MVYDCNRFVVPRLEIFEWRPLPWEFINLVGRVLRLLLLSAASLAAKAPSKSDVVVVIFKKDHPRPQSMASRRVVVDDDDDDDEVGGYNDVTQNTVLSTRPEGRYSD